MEECTVRYREMLARSYFLRNARLGTLAEELGVLPELRTAWVEAARGFLLLEAIGAPDTPKEFLVQPLKGHRQNFLDFSVLDSGLSYQNMKRVFLLSWAELSRREKYEFGVEDKEDGIHDDRAQALIVKAFAELLESRGIEKISPRKLRPETKAAYHWVLKLLRSRSKRGNEEGNLSSWMHLGRDREELRALGITRVVIQLWNGRIRICGFPKELSKDTETLRPSLAEQNPQVPWAMRGKGLESNYKFLDFNLDSRVADIGRSEIYEGTNRSERGRISQAHSNDSGPLADIGFQFVPRSRHIEWLDLQAESLKENIAMKQAMRAAKDGREIKRMTPDLVSRPLPVPNADCSIKIIYRP